MKLLIPMLIVLAAPTAVLAADPLDIPSRADAALSARFPRTVDDLRNIEAQLKRVVEHAQPATVAVFVGRSAGSGVIVSPEGLVLTAGHVIGRAKRRVRIFLPDGRTLLGRSLGANHDIDAGLVQLDDPPDDLPFVPMAEKRKLRQGEWVVTLGQPGGPVSDRTPPLRLGRVLFREDDLICTDCTLVGGDSGGPLINMRGEVVGIHSSIGPELTHNFHVSTTGFESSWDRLLAGEVWGGVDDPELTAKNRPLLGVSGRTENDECLITSVQPGMPAEEAGLLAGDVIVRVDGRSISTFQELQSIVFFKTPGTKIKIVLRRDDEKLQKIVRVTSLAELE